MQRYIHTFLRFSALLIIPLIVGPLVVTRILLASTTYTASADLWVDTSLYADPQQSLNSSYSTPAKQFGDQLTELLNTRNFTGSILDNSQMNATSLSEADRLTKMDDLSKNLKIEANGWSLIRVSYSDKDGQTALNTISSTVTSFIGYYNSNIGQQGDTAVAYYQGLVNTAKNDLDKATKTLQDYVAANPNKIGSEGAAKAVTQEDIEYGLLTQNRDAARKAYDDAVANLDKTKNSFSAMQQGQGTTLTIKDPPQVANDKSSNTRQIALGVGSGLIVGALIAGLITVILTLLDNKLRLVSRTQQVLGMRRVWALPNSYAKTRSSKLPLTPALASPSGSVSSVNFLATHPTKISSNGRLKAIVEEDFLTPTPSAAESIKDEAVVADLDKAETAVDTVSPSPLPISGLNVATTLDRQSTVKKFKPGIILGLMVSGLKTVLLTLFGKKGKIQPAHGVFKPATGFSKNSLNRHK